MARVFIISGLGADGRLFKHIQLPGHEIVLTDVVDYVQTDTLSTYAQKLINHYDITSNDIVLGDSLGGMIAIEVAKLVSPKMAILISSIKTVKEAPAYFKFFRSVPVYRVIPDKLFTSVGFLAKYAFGHMSKEDAQLFSSMLANSSPRFMKWAMYAILHWENEITPPDLHHIHGDADRVFPIKTIRDATIIKGGSHIMIFDKADEINILLQNLIN